MKQKIMAMLLSLVLVISLFVMPSYAEGENESLVSGDFSFAVSVGIMPESALPHEAITRIELAQCFANILVGQPEFEKNAKSKFFSDVSENLSGYADTVAAAGIMGGIGNGLFAPDEKVTFAQLSKTMVSFLGFDVKAMNMGGYPSGYLAMASWLGLIDKAPENSDSFVTCERVATMFKKAINAPILQKVTFGDKEEYAENYTVNYLSKYMGLSFFKGVINATYKTNVLSTVQLNYDEAIIGKDNFKFEPDKYPIGDMLGKAVEVYYKTDNGKKTIVYCEAGKNNNVLTIDRKKVGGYYSNHIYYYEGTVENRVPINDYTHIIYNGTVLDSYNESSFMPWDSANCDGGIKAIDNNGDGVFDFISIEAYETYTVKSVIEDKIFVQYRSTNLIQIKDYVDGEDILFRNILGEPVLIGEIQPGNIMSVSKDKNGNIKNIIVTIDTFTGELENYEITNGEYSFTIEGKTFISSNSLKLNPQLDKIKKGARIKLMFNKEGLVSDIETAKFQSTEAGYLVETYVGKGLNAEKDIQIKVFMASNQFENFYFADRVNVAYGLERYLLKPIEVIKLFGTTDKDYVVRQPIFIGKNEDGKIDYIEIYDPNSGSIDGFHKMNTGLENVMTEYLLESNSLVNQILLGNTVVFAVPSEENRFDYDSYVETGLVGGQAFAVEAWGHSANSRIASVLVLDLSLNQNAKTVTNYYMVVNSVSQVLDEDGIPAYKVKGYINKSMKEYVIDGSKFDTSGILPEKGDVVDISIDKTQKIVGMEVIYDESSGEMPNYSNPSQPVSRPLGTSVYNHNNMRYFYGKIVWDDEKSYNLEIKSAVGTVSKEYFTKTANLNMIKFSRVNDNISQLSVATTSDFYSVGNYEQEKTVFMITKNGKPTLLVVYDK